MASQPFQHQLHFLLLPMLSQGHLIPAADIAKLLAQRDVLVTIITTPINANRIQHLFNHAMSSGLPIHLVRFKLPLSEFGLPEGCESMDQIPSRELFPNFFSALSSLRQSVELIVEDMKSLPNCVIADKNLPWVADICDKFQIPRISFDGTSCFTMLCSHNIRVSEIHETVSISDRFVVPGLPDRIELTPSQLPGDLHRGSSKTFLKDLHEKVRACEETAYGYVINSFEELEPEYAAGCRKVKGDRVWCIGPVSLSNQTDSDIAQRGDKASVDVSQWLEQWPKDSVIYTCLGSLGRLSTAQTIELGLALEESKRPFIWVIRDGEKGELKKWIVEHDFERRVQKRGLLIYGWAPQLQILSHSSTGAFITHCGWNSILEGVCAGVTMVTWPMFADQFYNEKEIVQVLRIGVSVGSETCIPLGEAEKFEVMVKKEDVVKAIDMAIGEGKEEEERRERIRKFAEMAKRAMEGGGSSYLNLTLFIEHIRQLVISKVAN